MGRVLRFEIQADDVDRAEAFYTAVFGWSFEDWSAVVRGQVALPKAALPELAWQGCYLDTEGNTFGIHQPDRRRLACRGPGTRTPMTENSTDIGDSGEPNESYHSYSVDDEDQPQGFGDSLVDDRGLAEPLDEGYSPPEKWSPAEGYGNTALEEELGETLDQRIAQEEPEPDPYDEAWTETEDVGSEVGRERAGRLVDEDRGIGPDEESELIGEDVGIDGAGASAEEAAVHIIDEDGED